MKLDDNFKYALFNESDFKAIRSRGPGGQNVNKVSSAALMTWKYLHSSLITDDQKKLVREKLKNFINAEEEVYLRSDEFRDLEQNKTRCIEKLKILLEKAFHKDKPRRPTKPSYSSKQKKLDSKSRRGAAKKNRQKVSW